MESEAQPVLVTPGDEYESLVSGNHRSISGDKESLLLPSEIVNSPGMWLYENYTVGKVRAFRVFHLFGVALEIASFIVAEFISKLSPEDYGSTPFCVDPIFNTTLWGVVIILEVIFLYTIYQRRPLSITIVADKLRNTYFVVYVAVSVFFITTTFIDGIAAYVVTDLMACVIMAIMLYTYLRIKYQDDGRYIVTWTDYLGVHIHFAVLLAWSLMMTCEYFFKTVAQIENSHSKDTKLLGWSNQSWTVLVMTLNCLLATLWLYKYKDIYFAIVLSFTFFGIFSMQVRKTCIHHAENCSDMVKTAAISLGCILIGFVLLTAAFYPKMILYNMRVRANEREKVKKTEEINGIDTMKFTEQTSIN
jgi:hypothetical protein